MTWYTVEVYTEASSLVRWVVGASRRTHKDGTEESSWEIQGDLDSFADVSGRSRSHTKWETIDTHVTGYKWSRTIDPCPFVTWPLYSVTATWSCWETGTEWPHLWQSWWHQPKSSFTGFPTQQFKSRWRHKYLTSLREYHRISGQNIQTIRPGDVVLIHDDTPRITWKLAVIEELLKGKDGLVRAANIRTAQGKTNRPIARLIPF